MKQSDKEATAAEQQPESMETQFAALQAMLPQLETAEALPQPVRDAVQAGEPLIEAYVRFQYEQAQRTAEALQAQQTAAEAATGSLYDPAAQPQPEQAAFLKAFRTALRV